MNASFTRCPLLVSIEQRDECPDAVNIFDVAYKRGTLGVGKKGLIVVKWKRSAEGRHGQKLMRLVCILQSGWVEAVWGGFLKRRQSFIQPGGKRIVGGSKALSEQGMSEFVGDVAFKLDDPFGIRAGRKKYDAEIVERVTSDPA